MSGIPFDTTRLCIGGRWSACSGGETLPLFNPSDGSALAQIARGGAADIDAAVGAAQAALDGDWGRMSGDAGRTSFRHGPAGFAAAGRNSLYLWRTACY
jgi:aldehyde dehydrogenase (NAD+)